MINKNKVTIKDVARKANVSVATVSYVINGIDKVKPETRKKILRAIKILEYTPNLGARNLVKKQSRLIGVLMPVDESYKKTVLTENPFYQEFLGGIEYRARENSYSILIIGTNDEAECIRQLKGKDLDGVIVVGLITEDIYMVLEALEVPVVLIDQEKNNNKFSYLNSEDENGAFMATEYLINKGHRNIGFVSGEIEKSIVHRNRFAGYKKAMEKHHIKLNKEYIFISDVTYEGGVNVANLVKDKMGEITAVFSISDIMALGLIKGLYKFNIQVPYQFSIIGFDDIISSRYFIPELTTMRQHIFSKGEKAVEIIINNANNTNSTIFEYVIPVDLIERESVLCIN